MVSAFRTALLLVPGIFLSLAAPSLSGEGGAAGDPVKGKAVFARCAGCHSLDPGKNGVGPSLAEVFGRAAGTAKGFDYSAALKRSGIVWGAAALDNYLASPKKAVPGTSMPIGVPDAGQRADLVAYLRQRAK